MDNNKSISIDGWLIETNSSRISRDGVEKKLEPRSMELLLYFAEHPNQVVTRQEIEEEVWQGRVVGYDALSASIVKIRKAFSDSSRNPRVLETIPKLGYRLIAPVLMAAEPEVFAAEPDGELFERKLTAIFYADVAGYSRLTGEDEDRTHRQLRTNMKSISDEIDRFQGRVIHYAGDAVLAEFETPSNALHCALEVQQHIASVNAHLPESQRVLFRIGVNLGEVIVDGEEIYGDGVNIAARLESLAQPGGICVSGTVFDAIGAKQNLDFVYLGENEVKNIQRPVRTYAVHLKTGAAVPVPETASRQQVDVAFAAGFKKPLMMFGALVIVIGLLIGGFLAFFSIEPHQTEPAVTAGANFDPDSLSLAILPFGNSSNDPGQSVYTDGLADDLITDLSNINGLRVTPRYSSFRYRKADIPLLEIAKNLKVRYIVQGSVRWSYEDIRVNVQLVDAKKDLQVWSRRFEDNVDNIFNLQDKIIGEILASLDLDAPQEMQHQRRTTNLEAYDYFLRAEHRRLNARGSKASSQILRFYQTAIDLDPQFVAAYTGLAREALTNWQLDDNEVMPSDEWKKLVYETAGKALELDSNNAEALAILGLIQVVSGSYEAGISSVRSAVAINPVNPQLHADLATVLSYDGKHQEALDSINRAINQHETPPVVYFGERARIYFFLGQLEKALADAENALDIRDIRDFSVFIYGALNDRESAKPLVSIRLKVRPWENQAYYTNIFAYYRRPQDIELIVESAAKAGIP
ncbi:MAG: winged helix-turn-helix domain-containing protein [Gammaproteobacteria bacterium]|nr:winged helix-turn-helix domain-containing protein [Gammaproteobacteria bacterium]